MKRERVAKVLPPWTLDIESLLRLRRFRVKGLRFRVRV